MPGIATAKKFIGTIINATPTVASSFFLDIPRDVPLAGLLLDLSGTLNITAGTTNGTPVDENPMSYLRRIIVECTGDPTSIQLKNYRGIHAYRAEHLLHSREPGGIQRVTSGAIASTVFRALIPVKFALVGEEVPPDLEAATVLNGQEWSKVALQLDLGDTTDFINGGDRTVAFTGNVLCDVFGIQAVNVPARTREGRIRSFHRYVETFLFRDSTSAVATERKPSNPLPVGRSYRYLLMRTSNEVANARQPVDDTQGALKLRVGQTEYYRFNNFREIVDLVRRMNNVQDAVNPAGLNPLSSTDNPAVGYYILDFMERGRPQGLLNTTKFPAIGLTVDLFQDIALATARQIDYVGGFILPPAAR